jgi:hypothetical protein
MRHRFFLLILSLSLPMTAKANPEAATPKITSARLRATPLVARTPDGERQIILAEIDSEGLKDVTFRLTKSDWPKPVEVRPGEIARGKQIVKLHVPVARSDGPVQAVLESSDERQNLPEVRLAVPRKWTVYLVQHTHTDIGYTRPQTEILPEHLRYIDTALDFCDLTDSYPEDARFRWTCEVSWTVREYLKRRPISQIERLKKRIAEGRIELTGMFLNMSDIADENVLAASLQPLRQIEAAVGKTIRTAMQDDVNGAAWCLPDYFTNIGIKYLTMGINKTRSLLPFDKPTAFWWESPSGKRLLAFRPDHYMTGNFWKIHEGRVDLMEPGISDYLNKLADGKYPFDRIAVQFSGYSTDNSPPARKECDLVKTWNEMYAWPKLRIATGGEFPEYVEKSHAGELSVYRQAWPDWWTDGFGSAARETAAVRETQAAMQVNEGLLAIAAALGAKLPAGVAERAAAIQEALLFYDEHTFGAAESISDPLAVNTKVQWGEKSAYAWEAVKGAGMLREEALGLLQDFVPRSAAATIAVFNTLGWERSGPVLAFIDHEILPKDGKSRIVDSQDGVEISAQLLRSRAEGSYWAFWAKNVPPLGFKTYRIMISPEKLSKPAENPSKSNVLENAFYRIEVNPRTGGIVGLLDKETGRELVDARAPWQLGQLIYEKAADRADFNKPSFPKEHPFQRTGARNVQIGDLTNGPIWKSLQIKAEADGCAEPGGVKLEIRLYETEKRVEFDFTVRKAPITSPEAIYVAFPFNAPNGRIAFEVQGGVVTPGENQLAGSASDWQTFQSFVAVRDRSGQIILGSDQVPLVQLGDINLGKWQPVTHVEKPYVYSWVMNNYWFTNFLASQDGEFRWNYYLTSIGSDSIAKAVDFGWSSRVPLVARVLTAGPAGRGQPSFSALRLDSPNIALVSARPAHDANGIIVHLREVEGKAAIARLASSAPGVEIKSVDEVNVLEETLQKGSSEIVFSPYEAKFVRLVTKYTQPPK